MPENTRPIRPLDWPTNMTWTYADAILPPLIFQSCAATATVPVTDVLRQILADSMESLDQEVDTSFDLWIHDSIMNPDASEFNTL